MELADRLAPYLLQRLKAPIPLAPLLPLLAVVVSQASLDSRGDLSRSAFLQLYERRIPQRVQILSYR